MFVLPSRPVDLGAASAVERAVAVKAMGRELGFDDVGIAPPGPHPEMARFEEWLARGYHGEMKYMARHRRRRAEPERALRGIRSVIVAALDYDTRQPRSSDLPADPSLGWISRYAWGDDYHGVMEPRLRAWEDGLRAAAPGHRFLSYVDHGPVLEKVYGRYAGLGWMGKHTNLIHPTRGSWFFLGVILATLDIAVDAPIADHCGSCTACLDVCPTAAFPEPYVLDARRCLSYLTIELEGPIPDDLAVAPQVFGCDLCQDVCPWNRKPVPPDRPEFRPRPGAFRPELAALAQMDGVDFSERFAGTPIERRGADGLRRTAARVLEEGLRG